MQRLGRIPVGPDWVPVCEELCAGTQVYACVCLAVQVLVNRDTRAGTLVQEHACRCIHSLGEREIHL